MKRKRATIIEASGKVFLDLGCPPDEAANLLMRSALMLRLRCLIKERRLTQRKAVELFGVTQPRVGDLVRGKIGSFSIDILISMLSRAGVQVGLTFKAGRAPWPGDDARPKLGGPADEYRVLKIPAAIPPLVRARQLVECRFSRKSPFFAGSRQTGSAVAG